MLRIDGDLISLCGHHLHCLLVELCVSLNHELLKGNEVFNCGNLVDNLLMDDVLRRLGAGVHKLLLCHSKFRHQFSKELVDYPFEFLKHGVGELKIYHVFDGVLKFVLIFGVENDAVLVQKTHNGGFPPRRSEEVDYYVEEPVLCC